MNRLWPGPTTDSIRTALVEHKVELLPGEVEAWRQWISQNVCAKVGDPGRTKPGDEPFAEFNANDWSHKILLADQMVPGGPDRMVSPRDIIVELVNWYATDGPHGPHSGWCEHYEGEIEEGVGLT